MSDIVENKNVSNISFLFIKEKENVWFLRFFENRVLLDPSVRIYYKGVRNEFTVSEIKYWDVELYPYGISYKPNEILTTIKGNFLEVKMESIKLLIKFLIDNQISVEHDVMVTL